MFTEVVTRKLNALEKQHGSLLVGHTLAAIAAARFGLTEPEILDIISVDKEVKTNNVTVSVDCVLTVTAERYWRS